MSFVFDRNFDTEAGLDAGAMASGHRSEDDANSFKLEERLRKEGFDAGRRQGYAEGLAEAKSQQSANASTALALLAEGCAEIREEAACHRKLLESQMVDFALTACERVFPELIRLFSADRVIEVIRRFLRIAMGCPKLTIRVSQSVNENYRGALEAVITEDKGSREIRIEVDEDLEDGDARIEWHNGVMEYSFGRVCTEISKALRDGRPALGPVIKDGRSEHV